MKSLSLSAIYLLMASLAPAQDLDQGIEQYRKNDFGGAVTTLRSVVDQGQDHARANLYLGLALVEQGKASDAEAYINKADELAPNGETKLGKARLAVAMKDYDAAEEALKAADGEDVSYVRGLLALDRKQFGDAARDLDSYSQSNPDHAYAHYYAGMAYNGAKRPDKMLTHFEQFLRLKPDAPEARKVQSVVRATR